MVHIACIDYETENSQGSALHFWEPGFQVKSLAMAYLKTPTSPIETWYSTDLTSIENCLKRLATLQVPVICHNISFEIGVTKCVFPGIELNWYTDTARLTQLLDNGGLEDSEHFGLEACVGRVLPKQYWMHKEPYYEWIRNNIYTTIVKEYKKKPSVTLQKPIKRGQEGSYINQLPPELLEKYNLADVDVTLRLYLEITQRFEQIGFDWTIDHEIWLQVVKLIVDSKIRGVRADLDGVKHSLALFQEQLVRIADDFKAQFPDKIKVIEEQNKQPFNINSTKNLKELFVDQLGITPRILTKKNKKGTGGGKPSFSKKHLGQWGDAASLLVDRGSTQQVIGASHGLIELVEGSDDKRWHCDLKTCGTRTGRFAGGGNLNIQGLSRRNKLFMQNLLADEGCVLVSSDGKSMEPTLTAIYSKDINYTKINFGMQGVKPFVKDGVLFIDDVYVAMLYQFSATKNKMIELLNKEWPAGDFGDQWLSDSDIIKACIKNERKLSKLLVLAINYGAGAGKLQNSSIEAGFDITLQEVKRFKNDYWGLFPGVLCFAEQCAQSMQSQGYLINEFGYRNICEPHKAFNAFVQSSVSGLINLYCKEFFNLHPSAQFITIIHDEFLYSIINSQEVIEQSLLLTNQLCYNINSVMGWEEVQFSMGFKTGASFYEAK